MIIVNIDLDQSSQKEKLFLGINSVDNSILLASGPFYFIR